MILSLKYGDRSNTMGITCSWQAPVLRIIAAHIAWRRVLLHPSAKDLIKRGLCKPVVVRGKAHSGEFTMASRAGWAPIDHPVVIGKSALHTSHCLWKRNIYVVCFTCGAWATAIPRILCGPCRGTRDRRGGDVMARVLNGEEPDGNVKC